MFDTIKEQKSWIKKQLKIKKYREDSEKSKDIVVKFLEENPDINIECVIDHLKNMMLSSIMCAEKLGISPTAFSRLRKKYKIEPVYIAENKKTSLKGFAPWVSKLATKNFYTENQIKRIPQSEIDLVQMRAARSLHFPKGKNIPIKWERRGRHFNGKLKARTDNLEKLGFFVNYYKDYDVYLVRKKKHSVGQYLSKKETDELDHKYGNLRAFT